MNRWLIGILVFLVLLSLYGISSTEELFDRSRRAVQSIPTAASGNAGDGIESAGQNVLRQTSDDGLGRAVINDTNGDGIPDSNTFDPVPPAQDPEPQPAPQPANQDAIPALW